MRLVASIIFLLLGLTSSSFAQSIDENNLSIPDTARVDSVRHETIDSEKAGQDSVSNQSTTIVFTPLTASEYIINLIKLNNLWRSDNDSLKISLSRLVNHFNEPYDSIRNRLLTFEWDSVKLTPTDIVEKDTLPLRWLSKSSFIIDTIPLEKDPLITQRTVVMKIIDTSSVQAIEMMNELKEHVELFLEAKDTITQIVIDTNYLKSKRIQLHTISEKGINPPVKTAKGFKPYRFSNDSTELIMIRSQKGFVGNIESPFHIVPSSRMADSLKTAIETLTTYSYERDSTLINIKDIAGKTTPMWLTTGKDDLFRYWVKNTKNDSITLWVGNPSKNEIALILEEDVNVERLEKKMVDDIPFTTISPDRNLAKLNPLKEIPIYWKYELISSYSLNENYLSKYWAQGGESSLSSMLDINTKSEYNNKETKIKWVNTGRLRYGTTWTDAQGFRTTTDIFEINSQYNKVLRDKIDFSSVLYFKSQVAKGYNYPNDSVVVSRFLNPGSFTIGLGMEYKPNKKTSINFSFLSYRNTFVLDTAAINQTVHGIEKNKRSRQEMGGQMLIKNNLTLLKDMEISNTVRLFSSYLDKPQNVDIDWEMSVEKQISWYFKIRLNLHLIYDDDILFPLKDDNDEPILLPDGSPKKAPQAQFNQLLGLTLVFRI